MPNPIPDTPKAVLDVRRGLTSASSATMDSLCPGRHLAQRDIPEQERSEDAQSGMRIHLALKDSTNTAALNALNAKERSIFDSCREIEKRLVAEWFGPDAPAMRVYREQRIWVKFKADRIYEHSGEPDVIYHAGAKALILDYKTGSGEVEDASSNLQLRDLACLFRGDQMSKKQIVVECGTAIIQPLSTQSPVVCAYKEPDLDRAAKEMMDRVIASNDPRSPRIAGNVQCKFCRATSKCPEYQQWASATLPSFRDIMSLSVEQWEPAQRTIFMDRYAIAEQWLKDTKKALEAGATADPSFVPGYQMQDGTVKKPITNLPELINRIVAHGGTAAGLLTECGSISKEDLEIYFKSLIKKTVKGNIAQNKAYEDLLTGLTTDKPNKATLKKI